MRRRTRRWFDLLERVANRAEQRLWWLHELAARAQHLLGVLVARWGFLAYLAVAWEAWQVRRRVRLQRRGHDALPAPARPERVVALGMGWSRAFDWLRDYVGRRRARWGVVAPVAVAVDIWLLYCLLVGVPVVAYWAFQLARVVLT